MCVCERETETEIMTVNAACLFILLVTVIHISYVYRGLINIPDS